jgi:hypothetical protein
MRLGIQYVTTTAYHPQGNGMVDSNSFLHEQYILYDNRVRWTQYNKFYLEFNRLKRPI